MTTDHETTETRLLDSRAARFLLVGAGCFFVGLGLLGVALPVLPTFPFLLLAAWCYARSSPRLYRRLVESRTFGPPLRQWRDNRTISPRARTSALLLVVLAFGTSISLVDAAWLRLLLLATGITLFLLLRRIPVAPAGPSTSRH